MITVYIIAVVLGMEMIHCILKLIYEVKKRKASKKEMPVLLADRDSLGKDTVYRKTIESTLPRLEKSNKLASKRLDIPISKMKNDTLESMIGSTHAKRELSKLPRSNFEDSITGKSVTASRRKQADHKGFLNVQKSKILRPGQVSNQQPKK
ncbi:unnamed protein product [Thelazia callipaeda]|uniref:Ribosome biogenesis protein NOP53 n=1 Tax=Thelazia callipaeda TaxID=103827 RepID=A0A0N5CK56_THECL|nr:unnamed protein product [Thelazia callipaeda]